MNKTQIITLLSSLLLIILSFHSVIGENTHHLPANPTTPLFKQRTPTNHDSGTQKQLSTQYLGYNNNYYNQYFPQQTRNPLMLLNTLKKHLPELTSTPMLINLLGEKTPKEIHRILEKLKNINSLNNYEKIPKLKLNPEEFTQVDILSLIDPFSTVFPTCIILVFVTLILLYAYILVIDVTDFIIQVLENLF